MKLSVISVLRDEKLITSGLIRDACRGTSQIKFQY
jgi:hypothetical protein